MRNRKRKWNINYLYMGMTAFLVIIASITFFLIVSRWSDVMKILGVLIKALSPVIYGVVIAYLLNKIMVLSEALVFKKVGTKLGKGNSKKAFKYTRIFSALTSEIIGWGLIVGMVALVAPEVIASVETLINRMPGYYNTIVDWLNNLMWYTPDMEDTALGIINTISESLTNWLKTSLLPNMTTLIAGITSGIKGIAVVIFNFIMGGILSFYLLYRKEEFITKMKMMMYSIFRPKYANAIVREASFMHKAFGDFIAGKILDSLIIGIIAFIGLSILRMPYVTLISILIGITNVIPMFGPIIGAIPAALLVLVESPVKCLVFIVFAFLLQQFDGNILGPKILGGVSGMSGFWIMVAILFFGNLFSFAGMILGVPILSVILNILRRFKNRKLKAAGLPTDTDHFADIDRVDPDTGQPRYKDGAGPPDNDSDVPGEVFIPEPLRNSRTPKAELPKDETPKTSIDREEN
ncbi:MAG: AI-2E family transporter [Oscillospiraceae bacterium]|nr:AI-2E family transporter [Oscillospiraceae bacterium]